MSYWASPDNASHETLARYLLAILGRDLPGLIETLSQDELTLIPSDGSPVRTASEFVPMHQGWFAEQSPVPPGAASEEN